MEEFIQNIEKILMDEKLLASDRIEVLKFMFERKHKAEKKQRKNLSERSEPPHPLLSDVIGLYISDDGMVILAEKRYDGNKRLAGRVVYQTEAYRNRYPNDIPIGTFSNKWDENAFKLLVK